MARSVADHMDQGGSLENLAESCIDLKLHADAQQAIAEVMKLGTTMEQAWLLLADWVNTRTNGLADVGMKALLKPLVDALDPALVSAATQVFELELGRHANDRWRPSRGQRLRRALGQVGT